MAKKSKIKAKEDEAMKKEDEVKKEDEAEKKEDEAAPAHDDAAQDAELIKKLLKDYMDGDAKSKDHLGDMSEEEMGLLKQAHGAFGEMGYGEDESMKHAVHAMRLAKHMAGKQEEPKKDQSPADAKPGEEPESPAEDKKGDEKECGPDMKKEDEAKKEGEKKESEIVKLAGRVAFLEGELKKVSLEKHLDKVLKESGLNNAATKAFREKLGTPKTEKEIEEKLDLFKEAFKAADESGRDNLASFIVTTEKTIREEGGSPDFSDCLAD